MYFNSLIPRSLFLFLSLFSDLLHIRFTRRATNRSLFALWPASGIVPESSWWSGARVRIRNAKITTRDRARVRVRLPAVLELIDNVLAPLCPFLCCYAKANKGERREVGVGVADNWQRLLCSQRCVNLILLCCTQLEWFLRGPEGRTMPMSLTIWRTAPQGRVSHNHMRRQHGEEEEETEEEKERGGGNAVTEGRIKLNYNFCSVEWARHCARALRKVR